MVIETEDRHCGLEVCRSALEKGQRVLLRSPLLLLLLGVFIRLIHYQSHINGLEIRSFFCVHSNISRLLGLAATLLPSWRLAVDEALLCTIEALTTFGLEKRRRLSNSRLVLLQ